MNRWDRPIPQFAMLMSMSDVFPRKKFISLCYQVDREFLLQKRM